MTHLTRRAFNGSLLALSAAGSGLPRLAFADEIPVLTAREGTAQLAPPAYPPTAIWGFDGKVPGPVLRVAQGARLQRRFRNDLPQASTIHWHGIRIANAMDGVPGMTQQTVAPGTEFLYDFTLPDAGTYWYHPHNRSWEQMARGLYGALIVEEKAGAPEVDSEEVLLIDDWRLAEGAQIADGFGALHDWAHAGRIGNWITVNGQGAWSRQVARNSRHRLRLVNTANARIFSLEVRGLAGWVIALDGMPLDSPHPLDRLTLAPAQRADLIVDVVAADGEEALLISHERDGEYAIASFTVSGSAQGDRLPAPAPLPPADLPGLGDVTQARTARLVMEGGAMGRMTGAMMGGRMMDMRAMAGAGKVWAFNGMADMPDTPLIEAARNETIRIAMTNDTAWPHAMHLHGHHFRQLAQDGSVGPLRDTLLINRGADAEIVFVADNPGDWLLHCHMLEHAAGGMMTWIRVA